MKKTPLKIDKENLSVSKDYTINWTTQEKAPFTVLYEGQTDDVHYFAIAMIVSWINQHSDVKIDLTSVKKVHITIIT